MRIFILGFNNSGSPRVAARISRMLGTETHSIDDIFWDNSKGNWDVQRDRDEIDRLLSEICRKESWVIEGRKTAIVTNYLQHADLVIFIDQRTIVLMIRLILSFLAQTPREPIGNLLMYLRSVRDYSRKQRKGWIAELSRFSDSFHVVRGERKAMGLVNGMVPRS